MNPQPETTARREDVTVGSLMTADPIVVDVNTHLAEVATLLSGHRIGGTPVVDGTGAVVGVISETDLVRVQATDELWSRWPGLRVKHLMSSPVVSITAGRSAAEAAQLMESTGVHRLIVVDDEDGTTPVGVLSLGDLVRGMAGSLGR
jgi:CBS domain-containing protein